MNEQVNCKEVMNHICESLGEDMMSDRCKLIKEHLQNCPDCQNYFSSVEKTINFYKMYNMPLPKEAHEKLMDKLGLKDC